jgi:hypothetical protein
MRKSYPNSLRISDKMRNPHFEKEPTMRRIYIVLIICFTQSAFASSDEAWAAHYQEVEASCLTRSGLRAPRAVGNISSFSDEVAYDALLIVGHYPQPHMKNAQSSVLCLFNRKTRVAEVAEMSGLSLSAKP